MNPIEESIYQYINNIIEISEEQEPLLIQYCRMFSAVITGSFYVLDISKKRFIYIKPDDLLLCGYSVKEAMKLNFDLFPLIIHPEDLSLWNNFLEIIPQHLQALHEKRNEIDHISCTVRLIRKNSYTKDPLSQVLYQRMIPVWKNEKISYLICSVESVAYKKNGFYLHSNYGGITNIVKEGKEIGFYKIIIERYGAYNMNGIPEWFCAFYTKNANLNFDLKPSPIYEQIFEQPQTKGEQYLILPIINISIGTFDI